MKTQMKQLSSNVFIRGGIYLTLSNFIVSFLNYLFNVLAGRALGPSGYGEITALFSYLAILSVPITVIVSVIIQKIGSADNTIVYARSLEVWFIEKMKRWWFLLLVLGILMPFLPRITNLSPFVAYSLVPLFALSMLSAFYDGAFQGLHLFILFSVLGIIGVALKLSGAILAFFTVDKVSAIIIFLIISGAVKTVLSKLTFYSKTRSISENIEKIDKRTYHILTDRQVVLTLVSTLTLTLLSNIDIIFVKKFFSPFEAGIYSSWSLFAKIILYILGPLLSISFIFFTHKKNEEHHSQTFIISMFVLSMLGISSFFAYIFLGKFFITIILGDKFFSVIPYLSMASIFGTFYVGILYMNNYFLAKKSWFALVLSVLTPIYIIGLFLIPKKIDALMHLNIFFSFIVFIFYILCYFKSTHTKTIESLIQ